MAATMGYEVTLKLFEALGLKDIPVKRVIIDIDMEDTVRVYVEKFLHADEEDGSAEALAEALAGIRAEHCGPAEVKFGAGIEVVPK